MSNLQWVLLLLVGLVVVSSPIWIIVLIVVIVTSRRSKQKREEGKVLDAAKAEQKRAEIEQKKAEIAAEIGKAEPDIQRLKALQAELNELEGATGSDAVTGGAESDIVADGLKTDTTGGVKMVLGMDGKVTTEAGELGAATGVLGVGADTVKTEASANTGAIATSTTEEPVNPGASAALYIGGLLVVTGIGSLATAADFAIGTGVAILLMLAFYIGGIMVRKNPKLKPAGTAYVVTAMAMLPLVGMMVQQLLKIPGEAAWMLTSITGVAMYWSATILLKNKIVGYIVIASLVSTVCSLSATLKLPMMWGVMMVMITGILLSLVSMFVKNLGVMKESIAMSGRFMTAGVMVISMCFMGRITEWEYVALMSVTVAQLAMNLVLERKLVNEVMLRAAIEVWAGLLAHAASGKEVVMDAVLITVSVLQFIYSEMKLRGKGVRVAEAGNVVLTEVVEMAISIMQMFLVPMFIGNILWWQTGFFGRVWVYLFVYALEMAAYGIYRKKQGLVEVAVYLFAGGIVGLIAEEARLGAKLNTVIAAQVGMLTLIGVGAWRRMAARGGATGGVVSAVRYEPIREMIGVIGGSVLMAEVAFESNLDANTVWVPMAFLIEEVVILLAGVALKQKMIWIPGAIGAVLGVMELTNGVPYVWLILLGIGVIGVVTWRIAKR